MRRRRAGLGGYVRARLHRRIFVWFGATILLSCVTVAGVMFVLGLLGSPPSWRRDYEGMVSLVGDRFGQVWDDPARRNELAEAIGRHMEAVVVPRGLDREPLDAAGPRCPRRSITVPVKRGEELVGHVEFCSARSRGRGPMTGVLAVIAAGIVLWAASGKIARRLSRPLVELTHVAGEIGRGNLASRMSIKHGEGEVGSLALAVNDMATRIERQLGDQRELLAAVSHEIRTPLSRIRLLVELSRNGGATDKVLDELDREVMEIDALVGELLASSRLDFAALSMRELDAVELARRALERASLPAELLEVEGGDRRVPIHGDATLVARALANLLQNAARHGGGVARLRVGERDGRAYFEVEDRGPGFTDGDEARVFESFYRRESQAVLDAEGARPAETSLGLGLALVRRIAIAHGGRAYAENLEQGGARVGLEIGKPAPRLPA